MARKVDVTIGVKNKTAAGLKAAGAGIKRFSRNVSRSMRSMGLSFRRVATVGAASFIALIKYGNAFRASMAEVKTMLGDDKTMLPELTRQVRELSGEFGLAKKTLADGLYQALSAGIPAGNAIEFLTVASKAAVGGVTDVKTAVDGLTSVMNAYGVEASRVSDVSDILFTVVKEGKINFEELSQNIGNIAPFAKVAGVGIENLSAMIATLVKVDKPERAMTSLRQAMVFAAKEGKPLLDVLNEFEGKSLDDLLAAGVTQKSAAGIAIMSGNMAVLRKEMELFKDTAGAAGDAFKDVSAVRGWQRLWQTILSITSQVGETIDTKLQPAINNVTAAIASMGKSAAFDAFIDKVGRATSDIAGLFKAMAGGNARAVLSKFSDVIIAAFSVAGERMVAILKAAAPEIGKLIKGGMKRAILGDKGARMRSAHARMQVTTEMRQEATDRGGRAQIEDMGEWRRRVKDRVALLLKEQAAMDKRTLATKGLTAAEAELKNKLEILLDVGRNAKVPAVEAIKAAPKVTKSLIGIGNAIAKSGGASGISASTTMLSTGDLFTMMQNGGIAKKETELAELQGINQGIQDLIKISGGVE